MLSENIKNARKNKGYSQEELAAKISVVRQTVSKWEKGLSVPDSEMLVELAAVLDVTVNDLLGESLISFENDKVSEISAKLELINSQLAKQSEDKRRVKRTVSTVAAIISVILIISALLPLFFLYNTSLENSGIGIIGGADGPTAIFITRSILREDILFAAVVALIISLICIYRTKK